jgi:hypothetical protein
MPVKIKNLLTSRPLWIPLTTGATVRISPGQVSAELSDVEVANNTKVDKLSEQGMIEIVATGEPGDESGEAADPSHENDEDKPAAAGRAESAQSSRKSARSAG